MEHNFAIVSTICVELLIHAARSSVYSRCPSAPGLKQPQYSTASALGQALVIALVIARFRDNLPSVVESVAATGWLTSILQLGSIVGFLLSGVFG
jgi:hypothetical protein